MTAAGRQALDVGSVIADTYVLEALLGRGGMGSVFAASHNRLPGKKVAIKLLHAELDDSEVLARFRREAEIASRLGHPNIVTVHDFNVTPDGTPYLVLEYLHGETLAQRLVAGPLALESAMSIVRQVGSALAAAHREGIVHRDLKPQNVFLIPTEVDGRIVEVAKVLDFGISKIRGSDTVKTLDSALLGTPQYMAPEQAVGQQSAVDERTDVFAFGAMVYEMLCGQPAFNGASIPEVVFKVVYEQPASLAERAPGLSSTIVDAITHAMQKKSADRFQNVNGFVEALTGTPLTNLRPPTTLPAPASGWAAGSKHVAADPNDAFAQTMGSGDYGPAVGASAPTVESIAKSGGARDTGPGAMASTAFPAAAARAAGAAAAAPATATAPETVTPPRRRSPMRFVLLGVGCAIAGAATLFFVMRAEHAPHDRDRDHARVPIDAATNVAIVAAPTPDAAAAVVAIAAPRDAAVEIAVAPPRDAAVHVGAAAPHDAAVHVAAAPKPDAATSSPAEPAEDGEQSEIERITGAEHDLASGDNEAAMRAANGVLSNSQSVMLKRHAQTVRGIVYCRDSDQEHAAAAWRAAGGARFRSRIERACKATDTNLPTGE